MVGAPLAAALFLTLREGVGGIGFLKNGWGGWLFSTFIPFICLWILCAWMYHWIPNAKTSVKTAASAGLLAAFSLEAGQWAIGWYTLHIAAQSKIYGALWTFPVVLVWFYVSWTLILFGAEVAFFLQRGRDDARR